MLNLLRIPPEHGGYSSDLPFFLLYLAYGHDTCSLTPTLTMLFSSSRVTPLLLTLLTFSSRSFHSLSRSLSVLLTFPHYYNKNAIMQNEQKATFIPSPNLPLLEAGQVGERGDDDKPSIRDDCDSLNGQFLRVESVREREIEKELETGRGGKMGPLSGRGVVRRVSGRKDNGTELFSSWL